MPTALDNGRRSPRKLLRAVVARLLGRKPEPDWNNSTVLKGDVVGEVSKLKHQLDGEIVVPASFQLVRMLMEHDLVDELRLKVFPVVLGDGERLFGETSDKKPLRLLDSGTVEGGVAFLTHELVRDA